ncbi:hypothetical protein RI367_001804 [Sorochytrium milnesiophthora]
MSEGSVQILQWLHENVGITCRGRCPGPDNIQWAPRFSLPRTIGEYRRWTIPVLQWLNERHPHAVSKDCFDRIAARGDFEALQWLREHRPDIACPASALLDALQVGQMDMVAYLIEHFPDTVAGLRDLDCADIMVSVYIEDHPETLEWFRLNYPEPLRALIGVSDGLDSCRPAKCWDWMMKHPQYASWNMPNETAHQFLNDHMTLQDEDDEFFTPKAPRSLYDALHPNSANMPTAHAYWVSSAINTKDMGWLLQISLDYNLSLAQLCLNNDDLYTPNSVLFLGVLTKLILPPRKEMLDRCINNHNGIGLQWLLEHTGVKPDNETARLCIKAQNLGYLQLVHTRGRLCQTCAIAAADEHHQSHIKSWCERRSSHLWMPCAQHAS